MTSRAQKSARDEAAWAIMRDGVARSTQEVQARVGKRPNGEWIWDLETTRRSIRGAGVIAANQDPPMCLVFPVRGDDEHWQILETEGAPVLPRSRRLRKIEDGVRERRYALEEFAERHTSDMDDAARTLFRARRAADSELEGFRNKNDAALRKIEDEFVALMRRKSEVEDWNALLEEEVAAKDEENAALLRRVRELESQLSGE